MMLLQTIVCIHFPALAICGFCSGKNETWDGQAIILTNIYEHILKSGQDNCLCNWIKALLCTWYTAHSNSKTLNAYDEACFGLSLTNAMKTKKHGGFEKMHFHCISPKIATSVFTVMQWPLLAHRTSRSGDFNQMTRKYLIFFKDLDRTYFKNHMQLFSLVSPFSIIFLSVHKLFSLASFPAPANFRKQSNGRWSKLKTW